MCKMNYLARLCALTSGILFNGLSSELCAANEPSFQAAAPMLVRYYDRG